MMVQSRPWWQGLLRRVGPCWLLAAIVGLAGCKSGPTASDSGSGPSNQPATTSGTAADKKSPPDDGSDGSWLNSDRAKKISHDLDRMTDGG